MRLAKWLRFDFADLGNPAVGERLGHRLAHRFLRAGVGQVGVVYRENPADSGYDPREEREDDQHGRKGDRAYEHQVHRSGFHGCVGCRWLIPEAAAN